MSNLTDSPPSPSWGSHLLERLFERHQVPPRERAALLEKVLDISRSSARRRVVDGDLLIGQLERLLSAFPGESLEAFMAAEQREHGTLRHGSLEFACQFTLGKRLESSAEFTLVAIKVANRWELVEGTQASGHEAFEVKSLASSPGRRLIGRVAILDDQPGVAETLGSELRSAGFGADCFTSAAELVNARQEVKFDAYVLDWLVDSGTAEALIQNIRSTDASCPIAILTGQTSADNSIAVDIAEMVANHGVSYFEKPATSSIIIATLRRLLKLKN